MQDHDNDVKSILLENQRLLLENNEMLKTMRRRANIGLVYKIITIVVFLILPLYVYYTFLMPQLGQFTGQSNPTMPSVGEMQSLLDFLQGTKTQ